MLVRFTPKQRGKLKKYLETCELKGTPSQIQFEIKIYEEIKTAIDEFFDEKEYTLVENEELHKLRTKPTVKPGLAIKEDVQKPVKKKSEDIIEEVEITDDDELTDDEIDQLMEDEYIEEPPKRTKSIAPPRISKPTKEVLDNSGGLFTVDSRTKQ